MLSYTDNPRTNHTQDPRRTTEERCTAASNPTSYVMEQYIQAKLKAVSIKALLSATEAVQLIDGVLCRRFVPGPLEEIITFPVMPTSLQEVALHSCHDILSAGHQGTEKTLDRLKRMAYWVGMAKATELYCNMCQQ